MIPELTWPVALLFAILPLAHVQGLRAVLAIVVTGWVAAVLLRERRLPRTAWPMAGWIALCAASVLWSPYPQATLHSVFYSVLLPAGVFLAAWRVSMEPSGFRLMHWGAGAGALLLAGIVVFAAASQALPALQPDQGASGLLRYWPGVGVASTFAALMAPFAFLAVSLDGRQRLFGALLLAAVGAVAFATENRIVWPSLLLSGVAFMAWLWPALGSGGRRAVGILLIATLAAGWTTFHYVSALRNPAGLSAAALSRESRLQLWSEWIGIATEKPVLGHGFGRPAMQLAGAQGLSESLKQRESHFSSHGHNVLLDVAVQLGALGLALYVALLGTLLWECWKLGGRGTSRELRLLGATGFSLLVAMLAKNSTDDFMGDAVVIAFWGYAGSVLGALEASRSSRSNPS